MFSLFSRHDKVKDSAHSLFAEVVKQARTEEFYTKFLVPDTLDGRFDLIVLHMVILLDRFDQEMESRGGKDKSISLIIRYLQEVLFDNMDLSLREMGVGDLGVGKRVKDMADAFYGRKVAYQEAFEQKDSDTILAQCLINNIYRGEDRAEDVINQLIAYVKVQRKHLSSEESSALEKGNINFVALEKI